LGLAGVLDQLGGVDALQVVGPAGRGFYSVDYGEETCDCADFRQRGENCKHILALAIAIAKGRIVHPELAAGDPFIAGGKNRPCACNNGWVSMEVETDEGTVEEVLYLCGSCGDEERRNG
jgi:hypothetical protein